MAAVRRLVLLVGAILLSSGAAEAATSSRRGGDWLTTLRAECPAKRLDWLNTGLIDNGIEAFIARLPPRRQARMRRLAEPDSAACEGGVGCSNSAFIRAAGRMGLMRRLTRTVCALPYTCTAPATCREKA